MSGDLTRGPIAATMLFFALPMMLGNLLQQCYNVADTLIVGRFLGASALAAVGSSYTLMTFLTSILLGLCMGSGAVFSICHGAGDRDRLQRSLSTSFPAHRRGYPDPQPGGLPPAGPHPRPPPGAPGHPPTDAGVPVGDLLGDRGHLPL